MEGSITYAEAVELSKTPDKEWLYLEAPSPRIRLFSKTPDKEWLYLEANKIREKDFEMFKSVGYV